MPATLTTTQQQTEPIDDQPWASPLAGENAAWFQRFSLYAAMGAGRSVRAVYAAELAEQGRPSTTSKSVPGSWHQASHRYEWQRRAASFDAWRRAEVFNAGNAQDTERIKKLDGLIERLSGRCLDLLDTIDMAEVKAEDLTRLIGALLSAIDLMAKHTGGYAAQRIEHTGKDGGKIEVHEEQSQVSVVFYMPEIGSAFDDVGADPASIEGVPGDGSVEPLHDDDNRGEQL